MSWSRRLAALAAVAALALAGCTESPTVVRTSSAPSATAAGDGPAAANPNLAALKKSVGIPDCPTSDAKATAVASGLPDATLSCLGGGRPVRLAGLRGKPMIINLWAQWCGPCRAEGPFLAQVAGSRTVEVLGVDHADPQPELALRFAGRMGWTYPQLYDPDKDLGDALQVPGIPTTLFVRADGTIAYRNYVPFTSAEQIRRLAQAHLGVTP